MKWTRIASPMLAICTFALGARGEEWKKHWDVGAHPELRIHATDAAIEVRGGNGNGVDAVLETRGWSIGRNGLQVIEHQHGDIIDIEIRMPSMHFGWGDRSAHLILNVPRQLRADIHTGDGSIRLNGTGGTIRAETGDGSINGEKLEGMFSARTGDGSVHAAGIFQDLQLHTQDGSVEVTVENGSKLSAGWRVETGDGSVRIGVPRELAADLEIRTGDGSIHVDSALTGGESNGSGSRHDEHEMRAKLNGGGPSFIVRTGDGSVHIGKI